MSSGILCQACGLEAPTRYLDYHQNIGALVMRFHRAYRGDMCKRCMHKYFWQSSATTLFLGPWGMISLIVSPFILVNNIVRYAIALPMPAVPPDARVPQLDPATFERLLPLADEIFSRLNAGHSLESIAITSANVAGGGITPGQVVVFARHLAQNAQVAEQQAVRGFPVMPAQPAAPVPVERLADEQPAS